MPLTAPLTDELIASFAPDTETLGMARDLVASGHSDHLGVSTDGTWLFGSFAGSGPAPYATSADFQDPTTPTVRCNCPARSVPCKHGLALMFLYVANPEAFAPHEPTEELLVKRDKKAAMDEKKKSGAAVPKKINRTITDKKRSAQVEGLDSVERLLIDLVSHGRWTEKASLDKIEKQAKALSDAYLPAAVIGLRRIQAIAKVKGMSDADRTTLTADAIGVLAEIVQRARAYVDGKPFGGESIEQMDIYADEILAKHLETADMRQKGYHRENLEVVELAFERLDDEPRMQRSELNNFIDLSTGDIHQAYRYRPFKGLSQVPDQTSYMAPLKLADAYVLPGFGNRRLQWEGSAEQPGPTLGSVLPKIHSLAVMSFKTVLDKFREQLSHALAPREMVAFVKCARIGRSSEKIVAQDENGARMELSDGSRVYANVGKGYSNVANLTRALGMLKADQPAILVRLGVHPTANTITALPLAAVTPKHHLRLGV